MLAPGPEGLTYAITLKVTLQPEAQRARRTVAAALMMPQ